MIACAPSTPDREPLAAVRTAVEAKVWAFHAADTARDAETIVGMLWPDYEMLVDGQRVSFEAVPRGARQFMAGLRSFHTVWSDVKVVPLSEELAIASFIFRDSIVGADGGLTQSRGPTTFVWEKRRGEWRLRFGDADHYPVVPQGGDRTTR